MAYVDTVVVNGTEYEINTPSSKLPVVSETYVTAGCEAIYSPTDSTAMFSQMFDIRGAWRRTGTPGNYKYALAIITAYDGDVEDEYYSATGTVE